MPHDLSDYVEVKDRITALYEKYPTASLQSEYQILGVGAKVFVAVKAYAYRDDTDDHPGIGHSWLEVPGQTNFTRGSELENAETSAWGRAIAALGFEVKRGVASRQEIESKQGDSNYTNMPLSPSRPPASAPKTPAAARKVERGAAVPPVKTSGLTAAQRGKLQSFYRVQELTGDQAHLLQFQVTGKYSTTDMTNADFDKLIDLIEHPDHEINQQIIALAKDAQK